VQLVLMIELALMLLFVVKVGIRSAEQELRRKPFRYVTPIERSERRELRLLRPKFSRRNLVACQARVKPGCRQ
jgi:hypothetical protein